MYLFAKSMALFWTMAEGVILVAMRWGYLTATRGEGRQHGFLVLSVVLLGLLGVALFGGEAILGRALGLDARLPCTLYRWALWNFFCTVWVILEGCIMVYVYRLYERLNAAGQPENPAPGSWSGEEHRRRARWGIPAVILGGLFLFILFEAGVLCTQSRFDLDAGQVTRISLFYIRICGVFWIVFEAVVAVQGIRAYRILRRRGGRPRMGRGHEERGARGVQGFPAYGPRG